VVFLRQGIHIKFMYIESCCRISYSVCNYCFEIKEYAKNNKSVYYNLRKVLYTYICTKVTLWTNKVNNLIVNNENIDTFLSTS